MIIDVYPPRNATEADWFQVVQDEGPRTAADGPEETIVRVHLYSGETVVVVVPERGAR